jgi:hypothetical protein
MPIYQCDTCEATFNLLHNFQEHISRPSACEKNKNKKFSCLNCDKMFTNEKNMKYHMKTSCNGNTLVKPIVTSVPLSVATEINHLKTKLEETIEELKESKQEIASLKTQIKKKAGRPKKLITNSHNTDMNASNNTINSNNTANTANTANITSNQTINNNKLTIVNFGKEDIDRLSDDDKKEILNSCYGAILRCAKKVNFNPEFPEQRNIFLTNPKGQFAYKYAVNKYQAIETNDLLDQIIHHRANDVRDLVEQNDVLKISESKIERVNKLLANIDNEKLEDIAYIKKDLRLILFNENEPALENKRKYDDKQKLLK